MKTYRQALIVVAAIAATLSAGPVFAKSGKFDTYTDGARSAKYDVYTDGAKAGQFSTFTDGAKAGKFDTYTDGARYYIASDRSAL